MRTTLVQGVRGGSGLRRPVGLLATLGGPRIWWREASRILRLWRDRATSRARLRELDVRLLRDIGLDGDQAAREARKPFWQA